MAAVKASPLLAFYKFVASGRIEGSDQENASLLDADAEASNTTQRYNTGEENVAKEQSHDAAGDEASPSGVVWWYQDKLDKNPLLVKAITAFFILGLGDAAAQGVENLRGSSDGFDYVRAIRFGAFGFLGTPWAHYYYFFLDKYFPPTEEPFSCVTLLKLFIDQGIQAPSLLALIISLLALLKGTGLSGVKMDMKANYVHTLIANWILWLPASLINMAFVKPCYRVLYVNVVFFFWTILLSMLVNTT